MTISFYNNQSEPNVIQKTLVSQLTLEGTLRSDTNIKDPVILIENDGSIINYNYCKINEFERYYFIKDIKVIRNGLFEISLSVDVLKSFENDILNTLAIIDHTTDNEISNYLNSPIWESLVKDKTDIITFSNGLSESGGYVLITAGG